MKECRADGMLGIICRDYQTPDQCELIDYLFRHESVVQEAIDSGKLAALRLAQTHLESVNNMANKCRYMQQIIEQAEFDLDNILFS